MQRIEAVPAVRFLKGFQIQLSDHISVVPEVSGHFAEEIALRVGNKERMLLFLSLKHEILHKGKRFTAATPANRDHMAVNSALIGIEVHTLTSFHIKLAENLPFAFLNRSDLCGVHVLVRILEMRIAVWRAVLAVNEAPVQFIVPQTLLPGLIHAVDPGSGDSRKQYRKD